MIHLFRCHLQRSLLDLHSYGDYHVYITALLHFCTPLRVRVRAMVNVKPRFFMMSHQEQKKRGYESAIAQNNKIELISEKEIFRRNQEIAMQYSCLRFIVIIPANTE